MWRAGTRSQPFHATLCDATVGRYPGKCQNPECEKDVTIHKHLVNDPLVYSLVIVHESDNVSKEALQRTLAAVDDEIDLSQIYAADPNDPNPPPPRRAVLRHVNAFALAHYVAFTWSEIAGQWLLRDDTMCRLVGPNFEAVKAKCVANRYQPGLLFYEVLPAAE